MHEKSSIYVGETENPLHLRMNGHRYDYYRKLPDKPVAEHFHAKAKRGQSQAGESRCTQTYDQVITKDRLISNTVVLRFLLSFCLPGKSWSG